VRELTRTGIDLGQPAQSIPLAICEKAHIPISTDLQRRVHTPEMAA
jgi:hypothetical protein